MAVLVQSTKRVATSTSTLVAPPWRSRPEDRRRQTDPRATEEHDRRGRRRPRRRTRPVSSLTADLRDLGVDAGDVLLVHSSLSALGWVSGDAPAVVDALRAVVTDEGTLVMPTHTPQYTDPAAWENPPVPDAWVPIVRETRPPYRPDVTPTRGMGAIPECFRGYSDVVRGEHPRHSFAAWGAAAEAIVTDHGFDFSLGEDSPLARVYERDGYVLLLGVGHDVNTSLHLAEYRANVEIGTIVDEAPVFEDGRRIVVEYEDVDLDAGDFPDLGVDFEQEHAVNEGAVGAADAKLLRQRPMVDFAVRRFEANR